MTSLYNVGDIVYFRESAAIGALEGVVISGMVYNAGWWYSIRFGVAQPQSVSHYGDKISMVNGNLVLFSENELITYCAALDLVEAYAERTLVDIQAKKSAQCAPVNTGTSGTS